MAKSWMDTERRAGTALRLDPELRVDTALFDVDGTLVDSNYWHTVAWQQAFADLGNWQPAWRIHARIGMGGDRLVAAVAGADVERRQGEALRRRWKELYDELIPNVRVLPGATELLREVKRRGLAVVLASSGQPDHLDHARGLLAADDVVDAVTTGDDVQVTKPDGGLFHLAMRRAGGRHGVVIGDSPWDVLAAKDVEMATVALRSGGFSTEQLRAVGAVAVFDDPADLINGIHHTPLT
jgi:HAD superfamily hydrolase (TIGR01509 family)